MREGEGVPVTAAPGAPRSSDTPDAAATGGAGAGPAPGGRARRAGTRPRKKAHAQLEPEVYRRRRLLVIGVPIVVLCLLVAAVTWYESEASGGKGPAEVVTVASGSSMGAVTASLVRAHVVGSALAFHVYLALHGTPTVLPGTYLLHRNESFADVRAGLAGGPDVFSVDVLPGFTVGEVAAQVGQVPGHDGAHFLSLATTGAMRSPYEPAGSDNIDGLLGTGTYRVMPGESDQALLGDMIARFDAVASSVGLADGAAALGETPYQAITVASIVQKEGVYQKNLGRVARVIYNRLARGTPLQMDSTVLYSEHRDGGKVTAADLTLNTPYNTYLHVGLTPTPICFPSKASLQAALAPTAGNWLYFVVVSNDGTEAFSSTFAGQQANERLAQSRGLG
ncbi:MAG TPA: endolytic transglycosylase MltG [Acidimicrobiales bacterium]|nr:endolytic transglycosylase MltG [Acidimicrobiales bacterium]